MLLNDIESVKKIVFFEHKLPKKKNKKSRRISAINIGEKYK